MNEIAYIDSIASYSKIREEIKFMYVCFLCIARCDWLPERARWSDLARSGLAAVSRRQNFAKSHTINPLLTKFVRSRWLDIGLVLFFACLWTETKSRSINSQKKNEELGQYPAILTSHLVNNPYITANTN